MRPGRIVVLFSVAGVLVLGTVVGWSLRPEVTGPQAPSSLPPLGCPTQVSSDLGASSATFVPHRPAGVGVGEHLTPDQAPHTAVMCRFEETSMPTGTAPRCPTAADGSQAGDGRCCRGSGRRFGRAPAYRARSGGGCNAMFVPVTPYLVGFDYPGGGRIWVGATTDGGCGGTSSDNGRFRAADASGIVEAALTRAD